MLDESIYHFRVVGSFCRFYSIFDGKILLANKIDLNQTPRHVACDLGLQFLPMILSSGFQVKIG